MVSDGRAGPALHLVVLSLNVERLECTGLLGKFIHLREVAT
jgi:hypothetical protein